MNKNSCIGCGSSHTLGHLFDDPSIRICAQCRGVWLTFLFHNGFIMADTQWLVNELCENSHAVSVASYEWHDSIDLRVVRKVLRLGK